MENLWRVSCKIVSKDHHLLTIAYWCAGTTMADVKLELAKEEAADIESGRQTLHDVSASRWLAMGLDLEEQQ
jgi:hypothetical protein